MDLDLLPEERVVWTGRPERRPIRTSVGDFLPAIAVAFALYALIFYTARLTGLSFFGAMPLFFAVNAALGVALLWPYLQSHSATYTVTDERLIISVAEFRPTTRAIALRDLGRPVVAGEWRGVGTVRFDSGLRHGVRELLSFGTPQLRLCEIADPRQVADLIHAMRQDRRA
jgi:hypothetical protein